jgi:hypothetical protein
LENTKSFIKIVVLGLRIVIKNYSRINTISRKEERKAGMAERESGGRG